MPCNSIAVVQAKISPDVAAEILGSEKAIEGLRRYIEQQMGTTAALVTRRWAHRDGSVQCIQVGSVVVNISESGISVQSAVAGRMALQNLTGQIEAQAQRMAVALATDRAVGLLRSRYVVKADQTLPNGARVVRLSI